MPSSRVHRFLHRANIALLGLSFALIAITATVSVLSINRLRDTVQSVTHTVELRDLLWTMKVELGQMETDGLRYMIGSRPFHREGMEAHLDGVDATILRLRQIVPADNEQQARVTRLADSMLVLRARIEDSMRIKEQDLREGRQDATLNRIRDSSGESLVDRLRTLIDEMSAQERRLLVERVSERDALIKQTNATLLIANGLALVCGVLGFVALRRAQRESENLLLAQLRASQADRASREKSVFLASMSHEIRTPMNAIFGFAQLLSDHVKEPLQKEWVASIRRSGQMLLDLINDVLDLSKVEAGKLQLNPQATDIADLVGEIVGLFEPMAEARGLQLRCTLHPEDLVPVAVDAQRLRQVLMNLLSNAVKYTETGEVAVEVRMRPTPLGAGRDLRIEVRDTGVGIAADEQHRIFEPFYQAEAPDGKVRPGTGLGLSITRRLVELMQGRIHLVSRPGEGSVFHIDLPNLEPAAPVAQAAITDAQVRADFDRLPPLRILIADDVEWNIEVLKGHLRDSAHTLAFARDGREAVAVARDFRPDLVLMDLRMPHMDGYRACEAIRTDPMLQEVRVVAITASSLADERSGSKSRFDGHLRKPYAAGELLDCLLSLFGERAPATAADAAGDAVLTAPAGAGIDDARRGEALAEWHALRGAPLQGLRARMRVREIGQFSRRLDTLSEAIGDPALQAEARVLRIAMQGFDVNGMKRVLDRLAREPEPSRPQQEANDAP
jgi:signal transduction histidine kinase/ActR/RegA family two-component response regulator